jgi:hypothetical protein
MASPDSVSADISNGWLRYVEDAAWVPHAYDHRSDCLAFVHLPRAAQRNLVFLDPRFIGRAALSPLAPLKDLPLSDIPTGPLHFIFHTAFCCSTLLTRALDIPGVSMGLKEPAVITDLALFWSTGRRSPGGLDALGVVLDLLSRPLGEGETQIVKPSNVANHIIPPIMHMRPDAKAIVLYSSLDSFLRAIARRGIEGRRFARRMYRQFAMPAPLDVAFREEDLFYQSDLEIAAQAWLMQAAFLQSVADRFGTDRIRIVSADTLLDKTEWVLSRVAKFFALPLDEAACRALAQSPVFKQHAKQPGRAFDAEGYRQQLERIGASHADELHAANAWAQALSQQCGAPLTLVDTLF